jgi:predicted HTH transcriptional regulator
VVTFFLHALQHQMKRLAKKVEREKIVLATMPELLRIIEHAREHGRVTISDIVKLTGTSRNTLKQHFRQLVAQGHLVFHGSGRGAWYALPSFKAQYKYCVGSGTPFLSGNFFDEPTNTP